MAIHTLQLRDLIVRPVLEDLKLWSQAAENLVLGTAAKESLMGRYLKQHPTGPALSIYQMEPATHDDIVKNFLKYRPHYLAMLTKYTMKIESRVLVYNLAYATAMCRLHYLREKTPLPAADDIPGLAHYWNEYYNRNPDKGTDEEFIKTYRRFVLRFTEGR